MNVACTACPAKYAVPDERVRGKRVRITCKHCGTFIVVDGTALGGASGSHVGPPPGGVSNVRERRQTMLGIGNPNANAAASLGVPAAGSSHSAWLVALSDGRREPASLARIVDLFASGSIGAQTYIWREGMSDWKKPFEIPEIAAALKARGIGPGGVAKGLSLPPPDPDEATRVSFAPNEDQLQGKAAASQPPAAQRPSTAPATTTSFDDESVTVARSGPPSNPIALGKPLNAPTGAPGRNRPTLPPLQPAAGRPPLPPPSEAIARPRPNTIPPIGLAAARPQRSFTPSSSPFAQAAAAAAGVPAASATPSVAPPPPPPPPPPVVAPSAPPPAPSFPDASAFVATAAPAMSAPYTAPAHFPAPRSEFEGAPRSGPPVALQLDDDPFRRRRSKAPLVVVSLLVVAAAGAAGFMFLGPRAAPPPPPSSVAVQPPAPPPTPAPPPPVASETAPPAASASAAPAPSAAPEKVASKPAPARASRRDESAPPRAARKAPSSDSSASEASSDTSGAEPSTPESSVAERLARASAPSDDPPPAPKGNSNDPEFNRDAAAQGLGDAASRADSCRSLGGPTGTGQATVTFSPNGRVSAANVGGDFAGTTVGACITRLFRGVTVPAFAGDAVTVSKRFTIE